MRGRFNVIRTVFILFFVFVFGVAAYQAYAYFYLSTSTEHATRIECEDRLTVKGYFLRDESLIENNGAKNIDITVNNGDKVARGGVIANVYSTEDSAKNHTKIRELQSRIDEIKEVIETSRGYNSGVSYSRTILKNALGVSDAVSQSDMSGAFASAAEFTSNVIKSKISSGEIVDYSEKLSALENEMQQLSSSALPVASYITVPRSGYYLSKSDGLEDVLSISDGDDITAADFERIRTSCESAGHADSGYIGKLVSGSKWRVCFATESEKLSRLTKGSTIYIRIPSVTDTKIKCSVVSSGNENGTNYIVLESNVVTGDILSQRTCDIEVVVNTFNGLRVAKNAIRKVDGKDGVYALYNGIVRYRQVEVLYIGSTYAVVAYNPVSASLQVYDEVVVKGTDLYDGKVVS